MSFVTKDSGERQTFATGMVRDSGQKDLRPDLIPLGIFRRVSEVTVDAQMSFEDARRTAFRSFIDWVDGRNLDADPGAVCLAHLEIAEGAFGRAPMLVRWAELMGRGAQKYGERNWEKASTEEELARFKASAFRHFVQWFYGLNPEEDHAAAVYFNVGGAELVKARMAAVAPPPKGS